MANPNCLACKGTGLIKTEKGLISCPCINIISTNPFHIENIYQVINKHINSSND